MTLWNVLYALALVYVWVMTIRNISRLGPPPPPGPPPPISSHTTLNL